jgi:hypothetical protein
LQLIVCSSNTAVAMVLNVRLTIAAMHKLGCIRAPLRRCPERLHSHAACRGMLGSQIASSLPLPGVCHVLAIRTFDSRKGAEGGDGDREGCNRQQRSFLGSLSHSQRSPPASAPPDRMRPAGACPVSVHPGSWRARLERSPALAPGAPSPGLEVTLGRYMPSRIGEQPR